MWDLRQRGSDHIASEVDIRRSKKSQVHDNQDKEAPKVIILKINVHACTSDTKCIFDYSVAVESEVIYSISLNYSDFNM